LNVHALIPAAGHSVRFGGTTLKQYTHLLGMPVMAHSIEAVSRDDRVRSVTVALPPDDGIFEELIRPEYPDVHTVTGGDSRARTVMNGLEAIRSRAPECDWVLVHDAARPCLPGEALVRLLDEGLDCRDGAILAVPVNDTLKQAGDDGRILRTVDRTRIWAAQTPQLFPLDDLSRQLQAALDAGETPTDEASAMERGGAHPLLVQGDAANIKVTGSGDLALAQFILQRQALEA
jgi:2-C-methyl-D-erythritol 4-phosphate cytidylyltransferase